jgi:hypothetical protein
LQVFKHRMLDSKESLEKKIDILRCRGRIMTLKSDQLLKGTYLSHFGPLGRTAHLVLLFTQLRQAFPYGAFASTCSATPSPLCEVAVTPPSGGLFSSIALLVSCSTAFTPTEVRLIPTQQRHNLRDNLRPVWHCTLGNPYPNGQSYQII